MSDDIKSYVIVGLLRNCIDSLSHAINHFFSRSQGEAELGHDNKWIVISVYHAGECICNSLLVDHAPECIIKKTKIEYPSLSNSIKLIKSKDIISILNEPENKLLLLLKQMVDVRHKLMHRVAPESIDVSIAAVSLIGVMHHIELRYEDKFEKISWKRKEIGKEIIESIRLYKLNEYQYFVEQFLAEKYPSVKIYDCPYCLRSSVINSYCEVCFEERDIY